MTTWLAALFSVALVSLAALVGLVPLALGEARAQRAAPTLMALAVGALLGDAFIHLAPESFARRPSTIVPSLLILAGVLLFFGIEKALRLASAGDRRPLVAVNLIGDGAHNFLDGLVIGASWLAGPSLGITTTLAVLLHELPQELGDFGVLVHGGLRARTALLLNLASAGVAVLGAIVALLAGEIGGAVVVDALVPVTAGGFVYIAAADLVPELHRERTLGAAIVQAGAIATGIGAMAALTLLE